MIKVCVTGHRNLYGYDLSNEKWMYLKEKLKKILKEIGCTHAYCGMALGVDTIFAQAVLELKESGFDIQLLCAVPCSNQECKWPKKAQERYHDILSKADDVIMVHDGTYTNDCMQKRNEYMVDHSDIVIAVWDGSSSGTLNCIKYAQKQNKYIMRICP